MRKTEKIHNRNCSFATSLCELLLIIFVFAACSGNDNDEPAPKPTIEVTNISLNKNAIMLNVGSSVTLTATVLPDNATAPAITWISSATAIVTVDGNGKITGVASGTATITAKAGSKSASCIVNIVNAACDKVYEYTPAPGQFINDGVDFSNTTTPEAAATYAQTQFSKGSFVSLGGFGGYIIVGFDHSIENKGGHNGYDFSVSGNSFNNNSEAAAVWVMSDDNKNGLPDDIWYQLKGSEYGKSETLSDYAVTYQKPTAARQNVQWIDNKGNSGQIEINEYHVQDSYYPNWISTESYTLSGIRLKSKDYIDEKGVFCTGNYDWGYADNFGSDRIDNSKPTKNFFKIANAVKTDGTAANLTSIDFIKIQNALNVQAAGSVGELSTEVLGVEDENVM